MTIGDESVGVPSMVEVLAQLKVMHESVGEVKTDIKGIYQNQTEILKTLSGFATRQESIEKDIDDLARIVRDGNGQPSLVQRLTTMEQRLANQDGEITKLRDHYNSMASARVLSRGQMVAAIVGMCVTALLAAASIIVAIVT